MLEVCGSGAPFHGPGPRATSPTSVRRAGRRLFGRDAVRGQHLRRRLDDEHLHTGRNGVRNPGQQVGMGDQHLGAAVRENVGDLLGLEVPVDRHGVRAEPYGGERGLQERKVVAQQQGGAVAPLEPQRRKARGGTQHALVERVRGSVRSPLTRPANSGGIDAFVVVIAVTLA